MTKSDWRCPHCHQTMYLTNSARYWCTVCEKEHDGDKIDPMHRDWARNRIIVEMATERMLAYGQD